MSYIIKTAEPFHFRGGPIGCLLVHGFTGTPKEMRPLGEHLAGEGCTELGVRLLGHATQPEDMFRAHWQDWMACVEDGYWLLHGTCKQITIMGLSMGGILSLLFGARFPVHGIVAMSTPYELPSDPRLPFLKLFSPFVRYVGKGPSDWHDKEAEQDHISYPRHPVRPVLQLQQLMATMREELAHIQAPVLLIHSRDDGAVPPENAQHIYDATPGLEKELHFIEGSGHVITRDSKRQEVFALVSAFLRRTIGAKA
jgi:carboxylesterase